MKKLLAFSIAVIMLFALAACDNAPKTEYHPSGFDGDKLYVNMDGKTVVYEKYQAGTESFTQKEILDSFETQTEWEGICWNVFSTEQYPDLSHVLVISGTNSAWTYRISDNT